VGHRAIAGERADAYFCHIAHAQHTGRPSAAPRRKIIERADGAGGAHDQRFLARGQAAGAIIAVARVDGAGQIGHAQARSGQRLHVGRHLIGFDHAAQRVDIGHPRHGAQRRAHHPVEHSALLGKALRTFQREHVHVGQRRGDGRHASRHRGRQIAHHTRQALVHLIARPIDIGAVVEIDGDIGNRIFGDRAQDRLMRNAQHLLLDGGDHAAFHLLGRHARSLQDDLDLGRGNVGKASMGRLTKDHAPPSASSTASPSTAMRHASAASISLRSIG
jgi:hypothetical protein